MILKGHVMANKMSENSKNARNYILRTLITLVWDKPANTYWIVNNYPEICQWGSPKTVRDRMERSDSSSSYDMSEHVILKSLLGWSKLYVLSQLNFV